MADPFYHSCQQPDILLCLSTCPCLFHEGYNRPRELTWVTGVVLLFLSVGFGSVGIYCHGMKFVFCAKVGTDIAGDIPVVGKTMLRFLRGGDEVTGATLTRFFGFHVAVLPALATVFVGGHVLLVQLHGMHVPARYEKSYRRMKFFPNFIMRDLIGWILAIGVLAALAAIFPWELGVKADAFAPAPAGIKPEWYFLFMFQTLKYIPAKVLFFDGEVIEFFFLRWQARIAGDPLVNRSPEQFPRRRRIFNVMEWLRFCISP